MKRSGCWEKGWYVSTLGLNGGQTNKKSNQRGLAEAEMMTNGGEEKTWRTGRSRDSSDE